MSAASVVDVTGLTIAFPRANGEDQIAVKDVSLSIQNGEAVALVGESGSGKSMIGLSLAGLVPKPGRIVAGQVAVNGYEINNLSDGALRKIRGIHVGMIFQDPLSSLNPVKPVTSPFMRTLMRLPGMTRLEARERTISAMEAVGIPNAAKRLRDYPHQFSGGQRQRLMIALAMMNRPAVVVADEPTTALDAMVQSQILDLLETRLSETSLLFITHDLSVAARLCQRIVVMQAGRVMETGDVGAILRSPQSSYTRALVAAVPRFLRSDKAKPFEDSSEQCDPLLRVETLRVAYGRGDRASEVVKGVSFSLSHGEALGIIGESGSGKSSLAKAILRLLPDVSGRVVYKGRDLSQGTERELRAVRPKMPFIFQDPYASLDPRWSVGQIVAEPLRYHGGSSVGEMAKRVAQVLEDVGLPADAVNRYPSEFSGGQRQRIAIARALVLHPEILIADEPVSSLDVTIQKQIIDMLKRLREKYAIALVIIAHDLPLISQICDRILVLQDGQVVEEGAAGDVIGAPQHPHTRALIEATPTLENGRSQDH